MTLDMTTDLGPYERSPQSTFVEYKTKLTNQIISSYGVGETYAANWMKPIQVLLAEDYSHHAAMVDQQFQQGDLSEHDARKMLGDLYDITLGGTFRGSSLDQLTLPHIFTDDVKIHKSNKFILRRELMNLYVRTPDIVKSITEKQLVGIHGSGSGSLLGVFQHGLKPQEYLDQNNVLIASGTHDYGAITVNNKYISFVPWFMRGPVMQTYAADKLLSLEEENLENRLRLFRETSENNMKMSPLNKATYLMRIKRDQAVLDFLRKSQKTPDEELQAELIRQNFPVIYWTNAQGINNDNTLTGFSDVSLEFAVRDGREIEQLPVIMVPERHLDFVKKLALDNNVGSEVLPIEQLRI